jgi:hypothetical protein
MKFLIIGKLKDAISTLPQALRRQLTEASIAATNKQKKEGKFEEIYYLPGGGLVIIGGCKTAEEMVRNFNEIPINAFYSYEIYPLADFDESMKIIIERLKEAEKMMPAPPR